jgi:hypothetical protein
MAALCCRWLPYPADGCPILPMAALCCRWLPLTAEFHNNYYDVNFAATNFVLLDETGKSIYQISFAFFNARNQKAIQFPDRFSNGNTKMVAVTAEIDHTRAVLFSMFTEYLNNKSN